MILPTVNSKVTPMATIIRQITSPEAVAMIKRERSPISEYLLFQKWIFSVFLDYCIFLNDIHQGFMTF